MFSHTSGILLGGYFWILLAHPQGRFGFMSFVSWKQDQPSGGPAHLRNRIASDCSLAHLGTLQIGWRIAYITYRYITYKPYLLIDISPYITYKPAIDISPVTHRQIPMHVTSGLMLNTVEYVDFFCGFVWNVRRVPHQTHHMLDHHILHELHNYGKYPFQMGKSTISMAILNCYGNVYQRVIIYAHDTCPVEIVWNMSEEKPNIFWLILIFPVSIVVSWP